MTKPSAISIKRHITYFATQFRDLVHMNYLYEQMQLLNVEIGETEEVGRGNEEGERSRLEIATWDHFRMSRPATNATNPVGQFRRVNAGAKIT